MDHERFEILIEKRLRAATSADEECELEAHLAECGACRRELLEDSKMDAVLKANAAAVGNFSQGEWQRLEKRIAAQATWEFRPVHWIALGASMLVWEALGAWATGRVTPADGVMVLFTLLAFAYIFVLPAKRARTAIDRLARGDRLALVDEMRRQHVTKVVITGLPTLLLAVCTVAMVLRPNWFGKAEVPIGIAVFSGALAAVGFAVAIRSLRQVRALDRKAGE